VVNVRLTSRNISKRRLVFVASAYTVRSVASRLRPEAFADMSDPRFAGQLIVSGSNSRFEEPWAPQVVEAGYDLQPPGDFLEPGQHDVTNVVIPVPLSVGNTVEVIVGVATAFADRLKFAEKRCPPPGGTCPGGEGVVASRWDLDNTSWIDRLIVGHQELQVDYCVDQEPPGPMLGFAYRAGPYEQQRPNCDPFNERSQSTFGLGWTYAYAALPLDVQPDPTSPAR
jgi:hypothetical protein